MAETMKCPVCRTEHPADTVWCPVLHSEIPKAQPIQEELADCPLGRHQHPVSEVYCTEMESLLPQGWANASGADVTQAGQAAVGQVPSAAPPIGGAAGVVTCPNCGDSGRPGQRCRQCQQTIPGGASSGGGQAFVVLANGQRVYLPRGREVIIGRESEIMEIGIGLPDTVSRRHCAVVIDPTLDQVTVRDLGSLNHTYVGTELSGLAKNQTRTAALPVRLGLGTSLSIMIAAEAAA